MNIETFYRTVQRDPYIFVGLVLLGVPAVVTYYVHEQLTPVRFKAIFWTTYFREYVRLRRNYDWPVWPIHLCWLSLLIGFAVLMIGMSKL